MNTWSEARLARIDDGKARTNGANGTALLANNSRSKTVFLEGSGRFIGEPPVGTARPAADSGDAVTLNLVNVPAPQAAKTILGDILAVRYTVDPGIEGKVTIQTPNPVSRSAAVDLFQAALRSNNAALVNANGMYRIVALEQAAVGARIRTDEAPEAAAPPGSGVRVVQLKYVAAAEIRRILEPISPRGSIVAADNARNTITLSGGGADIGNIMEAISIFDVDVMKGMSFALVPVRTSQPGTIADELRTIFASDREGPMAGMVQFLPNKRLGAILIVSAQPKYLSRAESWVRRLDAQAEGSEKQFFTYAVQNRRAQELVDVLQSMFSNETGAGRNAAPARTVAPQYREASVQSRGPPASGGSPFGQTAGIGTAASATPGGTGGLSGGFGQQRQPAAAPAASHEAGPSAQIGRDESTGEPRVKVAADEAKNVVLIEATPADYRRIMRVIGTLDVIPNQVLIEATIAAGRAGHDLRLDLRQRGERHRQARLGRHHGGPERRLPARPRLRQRRPAGAGGHHHRGHRLHHLGDLRFQLADEHGHLCSPTRPGTRTGPPMRATPSSTSPSRPPATASSPSRASTS
jgi:general secretion pathway protein D